MNRLTLIESLPQPSLLYRILMGDIDIAKARLSSTLQLVPDEHQIVIKRTSLKAWRDSKQLDALQLIHDDPKAKRRKVREDLKDNQLLVIHVLLRLLEDAAPEQYTKRSNQSKQTTHVSNLYQAMSACAHGHRFPSRRTIDNIIETARARFEDEAISG